MSEAAAEATTTATEAVEPGEGQAGKPKPTETVEFWRQKAREQEQRAKSNAEKAKEFDALQEQQKSEQQKLIERAEAAEKQATEHATRAMRLEVAADKGLTPAQAKRLVGATREELEADADDLLANFTTSTSESSAVEAVKADLDLGKRGTTSSTTGDPAADFAKFLKRAQAS